LAEGEQPRLIAALTGRDSQGWNLKGGELVAKYRKPKKFRSGHELVTRVDKHLCVPQGLPKTLASHADNFPKYSLQSYYQRNGDVYLSSISADDDQLTANFVRDLCALADKENRIICAHHEKTGVNTGVSLLDFGFEKMAYRNSIEYSIAGNFYRIPLES
jgi:hypothetical protein